MVGFIVLTAFESTGADGDAGAAVVTDRGNSRLQRFSA